MKDEGKQAVGIKFLPILIGPLTYFSETFSQDISFHDIMSENKWVRDIKAPANDWRQDFLYIV